MISHATGHMSIVACFIGLTMSHTSSYAVDEISVEGGGGNKTRVARLGIQYDWSSRTLRSADLRLDSLLQASLAEWQGRQHRNIPGSRQTMTDVGLTPIIRLRSSDTIGLYAEFGLGVHVLSGLYDNNDRKLSTRLEFGSHVGVGYVFTDKFDIGVLYQHFSNGGIKEPNSGVEFLIGRITYRF